MGVRLNTLANPALRMGPDAADLGPGAVFPTANRTATAASEGMAPPRPGVADVAIPAENPAREPPEANRAADTEPKAAAEANGALAPRLRNFRFLTVAESLRERELETRLKRLERELEAANDRFQSNTSFIVRLDARLDRARLERDLGMIESRIGRMRLERAFSTPARASDAAVSARPAQPENPAISGPESSASSRIPGLNLLA